MKKYVIGIDYGTLSARGILIDSHSGQTLSEVTFEYPHGVMSEYLSTGERLPPSYALQHPEDYLKALEFITKGLVAKGGVSPESVVGIGIDFTSCTMLPIDKNGTPLCMKEELSHNKHSYVKLWKHHSAEKYASEITLIAKEREESFLEVYGGSVSCEWALPKILEILREAPEVYEATDRFIEAADWLTLVLTGNDSRSPAFAGYKWLWNSDNGYPCNDFLCALDGRLDGIVGTKIPNEVLSAGEPAGAISRSGEALTGLRAGTVVAAPMIDAHAAMPALGITESGSLMMIIGTSTCHILNSHVGVNVPGICGYVKDSVLPGVYTYEAGQAGVGDIFDWFTRSCVPKSYTDEAKEKGIGIHALLREKAEKLLPGESGLLALDWLSGNRSTLVDYDLRGMMLGMDLNTRPEEIYRALIEATAFGARVIVEQYEKSGIEIKRIVASGGIANKDSMMMQIYSDVLKRKVEIAESTQSGALGSAIYAAAAVGEYPTLTEAAKALCSETKKVYTPNESGSAVYEELYLEYKRLYDYFGKENAVMKRLGRIKRTFR